MANVTVKLFGVLRIDTGLTSERINIERIDDIFDTLNLRVDDVYAENLKSNPTLKHPPKLSFKDAIVFVNGERCSKKKKAVNEGDEIWLLSPASGG